MACHARVARFVILTIVLGAVLSHPTKPKTQPTPKPTGKPSKLKQEPQKAPAKSTKVVAKPEKYVIVDDNTNEPSASAWTPNVPNWKAPVADIQLLTEKMIPKLQKVTGLTFKNHKVEKYQAFARGQTGTVYEVVLTLNDTDNKKARLSFFVRQLPGRTYPASFALAQPGVTVTRTNLSLTTIYGPDGRKQRSYETNQLEA